MTRPLLLRGGRVIDPSRRFDGVADVLVAPRLAQLGLMDYHRGVEAIAEGRTAMRRRLPVLEAALGVGGGRPA